MARNVQSPSYIHLDTSWHDARLSRCSVNSIKGCNRCLSSDPVTFSEKLLRPVEDGEKLKP